MYDGKNIIVDKEVYKVGDTIIIADGKIKRHARLEKGALIYLIGGKHIGEVGHVEDIIQNKIIYKDEKGDLVETLKKYAFVVGDSKPLVSLS